MSELFAPPGNRWQPVSPALARMRRTLLVGAGVLLAIAGVALILAFGLPSWALAAFLVVLLAAAGAGWVVIGRNAGYWGYAERDEDLYIKHGALFRRLVAVPYGRMQYVDVYAGPVDRVFGLAKVQLHTASARSDAYIPGLGPQEAARLRDRLASRGEARLAGL